jgi:Fe-coproporphyrin III synthase
VVLCDALELLRAEGYSLLSVSGGEPLLYPSLAAVVKRSRELGFRVTMITNGLLAKDRMDAVVSLLDGMAISFDGLATTHNTMRRRSDAFERASDALRRLATQGRHVAAAISLTKDAMPELPDLVDHLVSFGAKAIQVRPVVRAGRARSLADTAFHGSIDHARLYLVVLALQDELGTRVRVHCDLAPAQGLWQQRDAYAGLLGRCGELCDAERPLADLVNPLVITDTGVLKPIGYDFDPRFDVGTIDGLTPERLRRYKQQGLSEFQAFIAEALSGLQRLDVLVDWFDHCIRHSAEWSRGASSVPNLVAGSDRAVGSAKAGVSMRTILESHR